MNVSKKYEKLLQFIYEKYRTSDAFRHHGDYPGVLVSESRMDFGDGGSQLEAFRYLRKKGWVSVSEKTVVSYAKVKLTPAGIEHVEQGRAFGNRAMGPAKGVAEILGRFVKGLSGR